MRKEIILGALILGLGIFVVGCNNNMESQPRYTDEDYQTEVAYQNISAKEAKEMITSGEYGIILDVRTLDEYNEGYIEGAILLPYNEIKAKAETMLYDKEEVILIYCRSGRRSKIATKELIDMGYKNVYDFGGIIDWKYELIKE